MSGLGWGGRGAYAAALVLLGACSTTVSTTTGPISDPPSRNAPAEADTKRRAEVRMELAMGYFRRGQLDIALEEVKRSIDADPSQSAAYNLRGLIHASQGDETLAEQSFRQALQINARDTDAMQNFRLVPSVSASVMPRRMRCSCRRSRSSKAARPRARCSRRAGVRTARASWPRPSARSRAPTRWTRESFGRGQSGDVLLRRGEFERARFYVRRVNNSRAGQRAVAVARGPHRAPARQPDRCAGTRSAAARALRQHTRGGGVRAGPVQWSDESNATPAGSAAAPLTAGGLLRQARQAQGLHIAAAGRRHQGLAAQARGARG